MYYTLKRLQQTEDECLIVLEGEGDMTRVYDTIKVSRPVSDFEADLANGYLFGEVLYQHGLLPSMQGLSDKDASEDVRGLVHAWQLALGQVVT